jgi:hypothetical protein
MMGRVRRLWPTSRDERLVAIALGTLLVAGLAVRLVLVAARGPAFLGFGDSVAYLSAAQGDLFGPPGHPMGYHLFVRVLHDLYPSLSFLIVVQHLLGVATALLLFGAVRRVAPAAWGLLPAGIVLLAGPQIYMEHVVATETLFTFLVATACYGAVRARDEPRLRWAIVAGLAAAAAGCIRSLGVGLAAFTVVWLTASVQGGLRRRLLAGAAVAVSAWLVLATYITAARYEAGYVGPGLTRSGGWVLYARAAPFADCERFTPPAGTRALCETRPPSERPSSIGYALASEAGRQLVGASIQPDEDRALAAFGRRAILHQPLDYLRAVGSDLRQLWSTDPGSGAGLTYDVTLRPLLRPMPASLAQVGRWYSTAEDGVAPGVPTLLEGYEPRTRLQGVAFLALVALALLGLLFARGPRLRVQIYLVGVAAILVVGPVAAWASDARYAIPGYGVLAAAGAIGGAELSSRLTRRLRRVAPRRRMRSDAGQGTTSDVAVT